MIKPPMKKIANDIILQYDITSHITRYYTIIYYMILEYNMLHIMLQNNAMYTIMQ